MTKGLNTIAAEAGELKATISQLATALTNNEQAHTRLSADMEAAQAKLKALQEASVAAFDELAAIAERRDNALSAFDADAAAAYAEAGFVRTAAAYKVPLEHTNGEPVF